MPMTTLTAVQARRTAPLQDKPDGQLLVHEVYRSIQGESTFAGLPCVFIRLAVCHLRCSWCDTAHAFKQGTLYPLDQLVEEVLGHDCPLVEITGGEPLLQPESLPLMARLADSGRTVLLETSGALSIRGVDPRVHIILDLKCPDSGEVDWNHWPNLELLKPGDQIKFVIASSADFAWAAQTIRDHQLAQRFEVLLSPVLDRVPPARLAEWLLQSRLQVRLQLQLHKFIWDPQARGV